ncbi:hypothetical protein DY000_02059690 [Brassica cretica]|uniref:MULE transposase N-terminal all-beta domain-containing protein n=1 Tax=Brassica cretica TaxID=69181 RepID=A0ABQ7B1D7_BRACR|nr:hypothetical protein DY000_02059690 [Brassica cretica]
MHIYASCGLWKFDPLKGWRFAVDKNKRGKVLYMELTSSFQDLRRMAFEYIGIDQNLVEFELSYLPMELTSSIDCPPVIIENDRQVKKFLTYVRGKASTRLCVSTSPISGNNSNIGVDNEKSNSPFSEQGEPSSFPPRDDSVSSSESSKDVEDNSNSNGYEEDDVLAISAKEDDSGKSVRPPSIMEPQLMTLCGQKLLTNEGTSSVIGEVRASVVFSDLLENESRSETRSLRLPLRRRRTPAEYYRPEGHRRRRDPLSEHFKSSFLSIAKGAGNN